MVKLDGHTLTIAGAELLEGEPVEAALAKARGKTEVIRLRLGDRLDDKTFGQLLAAGRKAGIRWLRLELEGKPLIVRLHSFRETRFAAWMTERQAWIYDLRASSGGFASLGPLLWNDRGTEDVMERWLAKACETGPCSVALDFVNSPTPISMKRKLEAWARITRGMKGLTFDVSPQSFADEAPTDGVTPRGHLPPTVIQRLVRMNFTAFRMCYEAGLGRKADLQGRVVARFVIDRDGSVSSVMDGGSDLPDPEVTKCVLQAFHSLKFPPPHNGIVTVVYPIMLDPG